VRYVFADCELDTQLYTLRRAEAVIALRPKVFQVLWYLLEHRDQVVSKHDLLEAVWPEQFVSEATLADCIRTIRQAVGESARSQRVLQTRHGHGYRFVAQVHQVADPPSDAMAAAASEGSRLAPGVTVPDADAPARLSMTRAHDASFPARTHDRRRAEVPFVGRQQQWAWFERTLHETATGQPRVVLVSGEAGIGKTRLLSEVQVLAQQRGFQSYHGRCYEDAGLPYLPFIEALHLPLAPLTGAAALLPDPDVEDLHQWISQRGDASLTASAFTTAQMEHDRLRWFLAMTRMVFTLAKRAPMLLVLDDVHWADALSLDLLQHLAFTLADTPTLKPVALLVVCTYRPEAGAERLARVLARLQRERLCETLVLQGLTEADVAVLLQSLAHKPPSHQLTSAVMHATRGNPLFLQEVVRYLADRHALEVREGYLVATVALDDLQMPADVTSAIARRLQRLSADCRRVLTLLAVFGDGAASQVLEALSPVSAETVLECLEEGLEHNLLVSTARGWEFAHPVIRQVVYQTLSVTRRQRLHQQIAQYLEQRYAASLEAYVRLIAHHLRRAGPYADAQLLGTYAPQAGNQALRAAAWCEAAEYYEAALAAAELLPDVPLRHRADLAYRAGLARYRDMDPGPTLAHYAQAIALYRAAEDREGVARALMEETRTRYTLDASAAPGTLVDITPLGVALTALGHEETVLHGHIWAVLSDAYSTARQYGPAVECGEQALAIGVRLQDDHLQAQAAFVLALAHNRGLELGQGVALLYQSLAAARRCHDLVLQNAPLTRLPLALIRLGHLQEARTLSEEAREVTHQSQDWAAHSLASSALATLAVVRGECAEAEHYAQETMRMMARSRYPWGAVRALYVLAYAHTLRGAWTEAEATLDLLLEPGRVFREPGPVVQATVRVVRHLIHGYAGTAAIAPTVWNIDTVLHEEVDTVALDGLCIVVELAALCGAPAMAEPAAPVLHQALQHGQLFSHGWICLLPRVLGVAASLHQQWTAAEHHFQTALEVATRLEARLELGRTSLDYARFLVARARLGDRQQASALLEQAQTLLTALHLSPLAQQAAELAHVLHAR
jgi:DNA-binding winged helix-turn-helix (wHTH) protein/tetratricopeptide (TPR) repeat protein